MTKIVLIIPYFGKLGSDFSFWLKSVSNNPTIDFLLITDNDISNPPQNLIVIKKTFEDVKERIQFLFDFKICLNQPYKLCDFRPCFGKVFQTYIKNYDFWGYTDTDIVYGDLRKYLKEDLLEKYNRIFGRGHLTLLRNTEEINKMYLSVKEPLYKEVFTFPCGCAFDEYWGFSRYWDKVHHDVFFQDILFDDIDCMKYPFHSQMRRREDIGKSNFIYSYEDGKLYRIYEYQGKLCKEETMYVHFQKRNMEIRTKAANKFMMVPNAYIPFDSNLSLEKLRSFDVSGKIYLHAYKLQWKRMLNKWKKIKASFCPGEFGLPKLPNDAIKYYSED